MSIGVIACDNRGLSPYAQAVLADGAMAYYRLGEPSGNTIFDSTPNARNGTTTNIGHGATGLIVGDSDAASSFNGTNQSAQVASASWMDVGTAFTIEALIKTSAVGFREIAARFASTTSRCWEFRIDSTAGALNFIRVINGGAATSVVGVTSVRDGNPKHVVATYDGSNVRLYAQGALDKTGACTGSLNAVTTSPKMGIGERNSDQFFSGVIDEVALYPTVLTGAQIANHFALSGI